VPGGGLARVFPALDTLGPARVYHRRACGQERRPSGLPVNRNKFGIGARRIHKVASVQDRVIEIVASQLGVNKDQITPETSFINDLGADSLDTVELVMELEEEFDINIPDDAAEKIQTVGQAVEFIEKHQASGPTGIAG